MPEPHLLRCRCGQLQGAVARHERASRAVCYCRDCQAFAHFLGPPGQVLDALGGTEVVAVRPRDVSFTGGVEHLACMSLTPTGMLRWYTACCSTPIGNTPRDIRQSHLGLVHTVLGSGGHDLAASFGPVRMRVNTGSARGRPEATPALALTVAVARHVASLVGSRVSSKYRINPLFDTGTGAPRAAPTVLTAVEHAGLMGTV